MQALPAIATLVILSGLPIQEGPGKPAIQESPGAPTMQEGPGEPAMQGNPEESTIRIGSKTFTESVILGELALRLIESEGLSGEHRREFGGTRFLWNALLSGQLHAYPEYTGTLLQEIYVGRGFTVDSLRNALVADGVGITEPFGFNNTYVLGMKESLADSLDVETISDLRKHPDLVLAFSTEFMDRQDGWPGLVETYRLPHAQVRGIHHDLAYRGIENGSIHVTDMYSTDAEIEYHQLRPLHDDLHFFPEYWAVYLYRLDAPPAVTSAIRRMEHRISNEAMIAMNSQAKIERIPESRIASTFLARTLHIEPASTLHTPARSDRILLRTKEHLFLVGVSLFAAVLFAIPLGIVAARVPLLEQPILGMVGVLYTIPSLALLVLMIPLLGIGAPPAILALFLYSLLPIVRNTHAGLKDIPPHLLESAEALGMKHGAIRRLIELPLASRSILAGVKTSAVINTGTATLGALIGAGGYGQPILTGIRLDDMGLILEGALPAAALALVAQGAFELADRLFVPRGLRLASE